MSTAARPTDRVRWLDGVRGAAALFVVLHHMWLATWPFYPENEGPWWLGWLLYGHLGVAVFIVVSGYSLALAPARTGGRLVGGTRRFIRRRAWRILPAYWAALVFSTLVFVTILSPETGSAEVARSFIIHGVLLQDVIGNTPLNGTFWSIAIEWQIYFVFPLILLLALRVRMTAATALTTVVVVVAYLLSTSSLPLLYKIGHVGPQFLALFSFGVLAAFASRGATPAWLGRMVGLVSVAALAAFGTLVAVQGSAWITEHWFWVDLLFGSAVAGALFHTTRSQRAWKEATLGSRPAVALGAFSYSLYLMHAPVLETLQQEVVAPLALRPLASFAVLLGAVLPVVLLICYGFFRVFERPFLERRDLASLRELPVVTLLATRSPRGTASVKEEAA